MDKRSFIILMKNEHCPYPISYPVDILEDEDGNAYKFSNRRAAEKFIETASPLFSYAIVQCSQLYFKSPKE